MTDDRGGRGPEPPGGPDPAARAAAPFLFRLYLTGASRASTRALVNMRSFCESRLRGRYRLEIVDISDNVEAAIADQIVAAPTLVKLEPLPLERFIGDLSNVERLVQRLRLPPLQPSPQ